ncbi:hypothetical protein [Mycobacteroides abscessus]|uniref:hypothetical protein n=1 Tax=Mycobacteroides abscessus TaxID=36809 RepID=UPI0019D23D8C|nr:hypothetical protein [Mycobacteroides abscessus]MBN7560206.1 hypothetical protein [Mycobacteroides abscessus subsp. abscessus]
MSRRADVDQVIADLHSYAASLRAAVLVDPLPPVGQLGEITEALNSSERDTAVTLSRTNYTQVRESDGICTLLTHHADKSVRVRVQHCVSGMYMACTRSWDGDQQIIASVSTNLAGKGDITDRACPVDERRLPPFLHLRVPPWTSWNGIGGLQIWRYTRMGIGSALYQRVHNIFPNARWTSGTLSDPTHGLRQSLHRHSPWHWEAPHCAICGKSSDTAQLVWAHSSRHELAVAHATQTEPS